MATTNHERVGKALDLLKSGLGPFVQRELTNVYRGQVTTQVNDVLRDTRLTGNGRVNPLDDVAVQLVVMDRLWNEVFRNTLGKAERSLVNELIDVRNRWAHQNPFSSDDADRALDSAARMLTAISA